MTDFEELNLIFTVTPIELMDDEARFTQAHQIIKGRIPEEFCQHRDPGYFPGTVHRTAWEFLGQCSHNATFPLLLRPTRICDLLIG